MVLDLLTAREKSVAARRLCSLFCPDFSSCGSQALCLAKSVVAPSSTQAPSRTMYASRDRPPSRRPRAPHGGAAPRYIIVHADINSDCIVPTEHSLIFLCGNAYTRACVCARAVSSAVPVVGRVRRVRACPRLCTPLRGRRQCGHAVGVARRAPSQIFRGPRAPRSGHTQGRAGRGVTCVFRLPCTVSTQTWRSAR